MKLLYIATIRLPTEKAHGLQIMKTCDALVTAGAEVELVVPTRGNAIHEDPFTYYGVSARFKITKTYAVDIVRFGTIGFRISMLWFAESVHFLRSFWTADVIYSRDALVLAQYVLLGRKLVYEAHTAPTVVSRFIARHAFRVIVISHGLRAAYLTAGVHPDRIIIAPDAMDLAAFAVDRPDAESKTDARKRLGLPLDKKIALYIGRLDGWKGVEVLCEAASQLRTDTIVALIGGEPAQVQAFKAIYPTVHFLGYHPYQELPNNQAAADVLVLPNTAKDINSLRYTSPLKLFTYMASDRPIVAADLPSIREVLDDESAFFFKPDDSASLAQTITEALDTPEVAHEKAARARTLANRYTWKARAELIYHGITTE